MTVRSELERTLLCMARYFIKIPRSDTNEVGEFEVTVTSELHARAERTKKQKTEQKDASIGGSDKDGQVKRLKHVGARRGTAGCLCQGFWERRRWFILERPRRDTNGGVKSMKSK